MVALRSVLLAVTVIAPESVPVAVLANQSDKS